jgi:hypothetical protein
MEQYMRSSLNDLDKYRKFLESIPLVKYRDELKDIKWVEQDLPKELFPLESIFSHYWFARKFLDFEEWFRIFWKEINSKRANKQALKKFKKYYFDKDSDGWFKKGFKARMYRTWISVLTQLDFCYVFEYICAQKRIGLALECNAELDAKGIDAQVNEISFQVKKISQRKEALRLEDKGSKITIPYAVFNIDDYQRKCQSDRVKDKAGYKKALDSFHKYFICLKNGFVVFNDHYLELIVENIDDIKKLRRAIKNISLELSGER